MRSANEVLTTSGTGKWSKTVADVRIISLDVNVLERGVGQLQVYFDSTTWEVDANGLICTDPQWLEELKEYLTRSSYDTSDVNYASYDTQGYEYVSLDVGPNFLKTWANLFL